MTTDADPALAASTIPASTIPIVEATHERAETFVKEILAGISGHEMWVRHRSGFIILLIFIKSGGKDAREALFEDIRTIARNIGAPYEAYGFGNPGDEQTDAGFGVRIEPIPCTYLEKGAGS